MEQKIRSAYENAREIYASVGVDTEKSIKALDGFEISLHCWQGDDCRGFESLSSGMTGGILSTGNYPGAAKNPDQLRADLDRAMSLLPGKQKVNLHAMYFDWPSRVERNALEPKHFQSWVNYAVERGIGLDFNPTFFSHQKSADGFTLSHSDPAIRDFWIGHGIQCRLIGEYFGEKTGKICITNLWIPDGYKDVAVDKLLPRQRLMESLDHIYAYKTDPSKSRDAVESKLFGIGSEAFVVGSHEFYMGYAMKNHDIMLTLDSGHFHPTEVVSQKISALLLYVGGILLHVSRPVRWDSDHVVLMDDELLAIMQEVVRCEAQNRVSIALDYFDGSINRVAAWVIGARNAQKALLRALLEPVERLKDLEYEGDYTARLALSEELKCFPYQAVWDYYCLVHNVPVRDNWINNVKNYEIKILRERC